MTVPTDDLMLVRSVYPELERLGYDRAFSFEAKHDPFAPLAVAAQHTTAVGLGTADGLDALYLEVCRGAEAVTVRLGPGSRIVIATSATADSACGRRKPAAPPTSA